jgi:hypothetical protein
MNFNNFGRFLLLKKHSFKLILSNKKKFLFFNFIFKSKFFFISISKISYL